MATHEESSIADLLRQLVEDGNHLVRTEIRLAKAEVRDNVAAAVRGSAGIGVGAVLLLGAVFTLLGAAVAFLTPLVGAGWAAVIVGVAALVIGGVLIMAGAKKLSASSLVPDKTVRSVKRDAETIRGSVG
ncbi:MAG: phage holin family protein [Sphingomonadaceae bacterium]|nr:phage holin family protein [Sphingomonadaceae bacterium]